MSSQVNLDIVNEPTTSSSRKKTKNFDVFQWFFAVITLVWMAGVMAFLLQPQSDVIEAANAKDDDLGKIKKISS